MTWQSGDGAPPLLCLHGNSCDHTFFAPQVGAWSDSRTVVTVDLRGHGKSDAPRSEYGFVTLAEDCAVVVETLKLPPVLLVGHSMGGAVAAELAARRPDLVAGVVFLDSTLLPDREAMQMHLPAVIRQLKKNDYIEGFRGFFESLFRPGEAAPLKEALWQRMQTTPQHVMIALLEALLEYEGAPLDRLQCPLLYVAASRWRTPPDALLQAAPQMRLEQIKDSGHFLTLEAPEQVNELVLDFVKSLSL